MIVDFHTHIFPPFLSEHREDYLPWDFTLSTLFKNPTKPMATAPDLISEMDASGVDKAVILGLGCTNNYLALQVNDYLLEMASLHRGRLIPFCSVNPAWGKAAIREVERCARLGARGIGELHPDSQHLKSLVVIAQALGRISLHISKLSLIQSTLSRQGAAYTRKASVSLPSSFVE